MTSFIGNSFIGKNLTENYKRYDTDFSCSNIEHNQMKCFLSLYCEAEVMVLW